MGFIRFGDFPTPIMENQIERTWNMKCDLGQWRESGLMDWVGVFRSVSVRFDSLGVWGIDRWVRNFLQLVCLPAWA